MLKRLPAATPRCICVSCGWPHTCLSLPPIQGWALEGSWLPLAACFPWPVSWANPSCLHTFLQFPSEFWAREKLDCGWLLRGLGGVAQSCVQEVWGRMQNIPLPVHFSPFSSLLRPVWPEPAVVSTLQG